MAMGRVDDKPARWYQDHERLHPRKPICDRDDEKFGSWARDIVWLPVGEDGSRMVRP